MLHRRANKQRSIQAGKWRLDELKDKAGHAVREYLATLANPYDASCALERTGRQQSVHFESPVRQKRTFARVEWPMLFYDESFLIADKMQVDDAP
ncbi:hypothetical protein [Methyloferula stellata]|uniref:hypothetical protein n=1 Tax=Methyloferula stellata TaxID=876270 RepID=UPI00036809E5|nr:hypothetical protein [Methyloferula stellata]